MKWNEYTFITLNDLSDYEGEINFLSGNKDVWAYELPLKIPNFLGSEGKLIVYPYGGRPVQISVNGSIVVEREDVDGLSHLYKFEMYDMDDVLKISCNCSEDVNDPYVINTIDNSHLLAGDVKRSVTSVKRSWQPTIDRATKTLQYELETFYQHRGLGIDDIVNKIANKDYFKICIAYLSLSFIYQDLTLSSANDMIYSSKSISYKGKYKESFNTIISLIKFDLSSDGNVDYRPNVSTGQLII